MQGSNGKPLGRIPRPAMGPSSKTTQPRKVKIALGSTSEAKIAAVMQALEAFEMPADIEPFEVHSSVPGCPSNEETLAGAKNRMELLADAAKDADYLITIESGARHVGNVILLESFVVIRAAGGIEVTLASPSIELPIDPNENIESHPIEHINRMLDGADILENMTNSYFSRTSVLGYTIGIAIAAISAQVTRQPQ